MSRIFSILGLAALIPADALACGGFFCQTIPVDQSAERIVFSVDETAQKTEMHVQVSYTGAAPEFAWIVPVSGVPELFLSTDALFQAIDWPTRPQFYLSYEDDQTCTYEKGGMWGVEDDLDFADSDAPEAGGGGGVDVIAEERVGPYETVTLQADSADNLITWLQANEYQISGDLSPVLAPYVASGQMFVALRLANDANTGDLAPLALRYPGTTPAIPIQLTSVAASEDMRLEVFLFGQRRFVPENYFHVQINEARVDWLSGGGNYAQVITEAANEAGGHAFATDYAGTTQMLRNAVYNGDVDLDALRAITDPGDYVQALFGLGLGRGSQTMLDIFREFIPMPEEASDLGYDEQMFYNELAFGSTEWDRYLDDIDGEAMTDEIEARIVEPARNAQSILDRNPMVTRLTSSLSPAEMTVDPIFVANDELGPVSNVHNARLRVECAGGEYVDSPRRLILADGTEVVLPPLGEDFSGNDASFFTDADLGPFAAVIETTGGSGEPLPVEDNTAEIEEDIAAHNDDLDPQPAATASCGGCDNGSVAPWLGLAALGLLRRRR